MKVAWEENINEVLTVCWERRVKDLGRAALQGLLAEEDSISSWYSCLWSKAASELS